MIFFQSVRNTDLYIDSDNRKKFDAWYTILKNLTLKLVRKKYTEYQGNKLIRWTSRKCWLAIPVKNLSQANCGKMYIPGPDEMI